MIRCEPSKGTDLTKVTFTIPADGLEGPPAVVWGSSTTGNPAPTPSSGRAQRTKRRWP